MLASTREIVISMLFDNMRILPQLESCEATGIETATLMLNTTNINNEKKIHEQ